MLLSFKGNSLLHSIARLEAKGNSDYRGQKSMDFSPRLFVKNPLFIIFGGLYIKYLYLLVYYLFSFVFATFTEGLGGNL